MDKALSFANGVRIGEAWLRDSVQGDRKGKAAEAKTDRLESAMSSEQHDGVTARVSTGEALDDSVPLASNTPVQAIGNTAEPRTASPGAGIGADALRAPAPAVAEARTAAAGPRSPVVESEPAVAGTQPPVAGSRSPVAGTQPLVAGSRSPVAGSQPLVAGSPTGVDTAIFSSAAVSGSVSTLAPMRGVTIGVFDGPAAGSSREPLQRSLASQALAATFFLLAVVPPIATTLLLGLSHRAPLIPFAPVWAWMALLIALGATVRSAMAAAAHQKGTPGPSWLAPVLLGVLLLVPSAIVLYLRLTLSPAPVRLAIAQVALYAIGVVALLLASHVPEAE